MALIYIVEDDANIREIETFALKNSGYRIEGCETGRDFFKRIAETLPDLILLDIMLPDMDGLEILKSLRSKPETRYLPVIMVTAKTTEIDKVKGLDMGADDYLTKPFGVMELISRVKALLRRSSHAEEEKILRCDSLVMDVERRLVYVDSETEETTPIELTYKEFELLHYFMVNRGIVLKRESIMERVWGIDFEGESRTLDMHIKTLRQKLGETGKNIITIRNVGYELK